MSRDFKLRLVMLLTELDIGQLGNREMDIYTELKPSGILLGHSMRDIVASVVFYTQRELGNYVNMVEICKESGAHKTTVFRLVGKMARHYGTVSIIANPSVMSRVDKLVKQLDSQNKKKQEYYFNYLLEGFNKYEVLADEHGLHKGRGYYAAIAYILLEPKGYSQESICGYINCNLYTLRNNMKRIQNIMGSVADA